MICLLRDTSLWAKS